MSNSEMPFSSKLEPRGAQIFRRREAPTTPAVWVRHCSNPRIAPISLFVVGAIA